MLKRIAIMGGTFDPIHIGHLLAATYVYESGSFDHIWIMPSGSPPHKSHEVTASDHRLNMCKLAVKDIDGLRLSDFEINREGMVYSIDTFNLLSEQYKDCAFYLIIGTDSLMSLEKWYRFEELMRVGKFVVVDRGGYDTKKVDALTDRYYNQYGTEFIRVEMPSIELSSSDIRQRIKNNLPIKYMIPDGVAEYIREFNLYQQ